jgi:hypothetical protein
VSRFQKFLIASVIAAVAIPAGIVLAGFDGSETFDPNIQSYDSVGGRTTDSTSFSDIEGLQMSAAGIGEQLTLSAEMSSGKARFKLASADFDPGIPPTPATGVVFTAPAANSYTFYNRNDCHSYTVQWKRVGSQPAKIARAALQGIGDGAACGL